MLLQFLPMLKGMLRTTSEVFKEPVKAKVIAPRVDKKCKASPTDPAYICGHVAPDSLVVHTVHKRTDAQASGDDPPPDKEGKKLDAAGKRVAVQ
mgnify:CR=1 FL=1